MKRREFLAATLAAASALSTGFRSAAARPAGRRPNLVLIMADDLGYECLGCYGSASYKTPVLDRLARTGMRFTQCHSQPLCTPSRVKIMTGKYNSRNYRAFGMLDPGETTFAHLLRDAGYTTGIAGKWQLFGRHGEWVGRGSRPDQAGFDDWCLWQIEEKGYRYADPLIEEKGKGLRELPGEYGPELFCDFIDGFIDRNRDNPFFLYYPMCLVHNPFVPTPDSPEWSGDRHKNNNKHFADMVAYMDKGVGRILDKLDEHGLRQDTLVLFTGDNGTNRKIVSEMTDGRRIQGGKGMTIDTGTHVPFIAHQPGFVPEGRVCDDLIGFEDFLPTLMDAAGESMPDDLEIDGRSFLPQLQGLRGNPRTFLYCHYDPKWGKWEKSCFVHDQRWKLYDDGRLYDIQADPLEQQPLSGDGENTKARAARAVLQAALDTIH